MSALTDGRWKYIFHARDGAQQLFHLGSDPCELADLSGDPLHQNELRRWRSRLVSHLAERGAPFVVNGDLALRPERMPYGKLYPRKNS